MDESFSLRRFVDQSLHEMALFDESMCYLAASGPFRRHWGLPTVFSGPRHCDLFPELPGRWRDAFGEAVRGEWRSREHDPFPRPARGRTEWMDWEMGPWYRADGAIGGAVLLAYNANRQVHIERQLQRIEDQLRRIEQERRSLMTTATDGILVMDRDGSIVSCNPALERMFGYAEEELRGRNFTLLLADKATGHGATGAGRSAAFDHAPVSQGPRILAGLRKDGSCFQFRLALSEIDHLDVFVGYAQDQTEYIALREEIVSVSNLEQQRIGRELHDATQQELTGLALLANALVESLEARHAPPDEITIGRQLSASLAATQRSVQDLARGLLPVPIDSQDLKGALAALATSAARGTRVRLATEFTGEAPRFSAEAATHLYRIAQEGINNALRHANPTRVTLRLAATEQGCELQVEDDGTGFDPAHPSPTGVGIRLMEHRCSLAGGNLQLACPSTGGTRITCAIALPARSPS